MSSKLCSARCHWTQLQAESWVGRMATATRRAYKKSQQRSGVASVRDGYGGSSSAPTLGPKRVFIPGENGPPMNVSESKASYLSRAIDSQDIGTDSKGYMKRLHDAGAYLCEQLVQDPNILVSL